MKLSLGTDRRFFNSIMIVCFLFTLSGCKESGVRNDLLAKIDSVKNNYNNRLIEVGKRLYLASRHNIIVDFIHFNEYVILNERKIPSLAMNGTIRGKYSLWINDNGIIEEIRTNIIKFKVDSSFKNPMYKFEFEEFDNYLDMDKINDERYLREYYEKYCLNDKFDPYGYISGVTMYSVYQDDFKIRLYDSHKNRGQNRDE